MAPEHILLCYRRCPAGDVALVRAAELATETGARLTVLVPLLEVDRSPRCCGIQGKQWRSLVRGALREELEHAAKVLADPGVELALGEGPTIAAAVAGYAERNGCDLVGLPDGGLWSRAGTPRRELREIERRAPGRVIRLVPGARVRLHAVN